MQGLAIRCSGAQIGWTNNYDDSVIAAIQNGGVTELIPYVYTNIKDDAKHMYDMHGVRRSWVGALAWFRRYLLRTRLFVFIGVLAFPASCVPSCAQTLRNPGLEAPYAGSGETVVANGWRAFRISGSRQFLQSTGEKMEALSSQQIQSNSFEYDAGVYQRIPGCKVGAEYRFAGWLCTSYDHGFSQVRNCPDGMMIKRIGVDPRGGTNPSSPSVIWSWEEPLDRRWRRLMVDFKAQSGTVTVFARVQNRGEVGYDLAWLDVFEFGPTSQVRISDPEAHPGSTSAVITWKTDLPSDSKVRYWRWQTTDQKDKDPREVSGQPISTEHSVTISGLAPDRKYYFEVVSKGPQTSAKQETVAGGQVFSTTSGQNATR